MAGSLNRVMLIGNLGADPEVRTLNSGDKVVNLRIACSESWRDKNSGERREKTEWVSVVIFNENIGKVAEQYLSKGSKVFIEGKLRTRKWQDQQGQDRYTTEVVLESFGGSLVMLGGGEKSEDGDDRGGRGGDSRGGGSSKGSGGGGSRSQGGGGRPAMDDEIPFLYEWR